MISQVKSRPLYKKINVRSKLVFKNVSSCYVSKTDEKAEIKAERDVSLIGNIEASQQF